VGAVLSQRFLSDSKLHPCAFFSRKLSPAERNYDVATVSSSLSYGLWRSGAIGWRELTSRSSFRLTTNYKLTYLQSCQFRWMLFLGHFNFTLSYRPGSRNIKPDALSRIYTTEEGNLDPAPILPPSSRFKIQDFFIAICSTMEFLLPIHSCSNLLNINSKQLQILNN